MTAPFTNWNHLDIYETKARLFIVARNSSESHFRVLKIDRTTATRDEQAERVQLVEDPTVYTHSEKEQLLCMISEGNKGVAGGLKRLTSACAIIGFVRFLEGFYLYLVIKSNVVGEIAGHAIYRADECKLICLEHADRNLNEQRYVDLFLSIDLTKNFYFSYTYDLTHTLQFNCTLAKSDEFQDMFMWNYYLLRNGFDTIRKGSPWIVPFIHGYFQQSRHYVLNRNLIMTLIARRSRHFAGARFLKRGVNDQGYVANDVETEQIVYEASRSISSMQQDGAYTSFVQHRGSIPLYWSQGASNMAPKPPIQVNFIDPFYSSTALHFQDMFERYGSPVIVLNLVKHAEKTKREAILLHEYTQALKYLNQFLPNEHRIRYVAFDMSRAAKSEDQDVMTVLEEIAEQSLLSTGFYHCGKEPFFNSVRSGLNGFARDGMLLQHGVVRTNCIDCLDRTNAAQFVLGKAALAHQLFALGFIEDKRLSFEMSVVKSLMEMYHDHGDIIALQYGGSALVNTMETYRKTMAWSTHSRDMLESVKRYYNNSFTDAEKQDAINLFLGNFVAHPDRTQIWELETDFYLHHEDPRFPKNRPNYGQWFNKQLLDRRHGDQNTFRPMSFEEYHQVHKLTSFDEHFTTHLDSAGDDIEYRPFERSDGSRDKSEWLTRENQIRGKVINGQTTSTIWDDELPIIPEKPYKSTNMTTEALLKKITRPMVSKQELNEYERYMAQFTSASSWMDMTVVTPSDRQIYTTYINRKKAPELQEEISAKDLGIYQKAVALSKNNVNNLQLNSSYEEYSRWLSNGHMFQQQNKV